MENLKAVLTTVDSHRRDPDKSKFYCLVHNLLLVIQIWTAILTGAYEELRESPPFSVT